MPRYTIRDPTTGRTVTLEGPSPPTEAELEDIFKTVNAQGGTPRVAPTTTSVGIGPFRHDVPTTSLPTDIQASLSQPSAPSGDIVLQNAKNLVDTGINALPAIGGTAGGILGSPAGPAGAIGGATLGGGAGEAAKQLITRALGRAAPPTMTAAATDIGVQGAAQGAAEGLGQAVTAAAPVVAKAVYRGYLKPSLSARLLPKADQIVQTALDEALPISRTGVQTGERLINDLTDQVDTIIAQTPGTIDLHDVADQVRTFAKDRYFKPGVPSTDYDAALAVADSLDKHASQMLAPPAMPQTAVSLADANDTKRSLYTAIKETGFGTAQGATKTTQKYAAHELKTGLEAAAPAVGPLNARESQLIDAAKAISRAVERDANQNQLYGVKTLASAALGGGAASAGAGTIPALAGAALTRGALTAPVASRAAILTYRLQKELGVSTSLATRLAAYVLSDQGQQDQPHGP